MNDPQETVEDEALGQLVGSVGAFLADIGAYCTAPFPGGLQFLPTAGVEQEAEAVREAMQVLTFTAEQRLQGLANTVTALHRAAAVYLSALFRLALAAALAHDEAVAGDGAAS